MEIEQQNDARGGSFSGVMNGKKVAHMTYRWAGPQKMVIDHTEVGPGYEGKGLGKSLVLRAVAYARENGIRILPVCPFAQRVFEKYPVLSDVLF